MLLEAVICRSPLLHLVRPTFVRSKPSAILERRQLRSTFGLEPAQTSSNIATARNIRAMAQAASGLRPRAAAIERKMREAFDPLVVNIIDDSQQHAGHAGNPSGDPSAETHLRLQIVSSAFEGKSLVQRHKSIYALLDDEFKAGLHALSLNVKTPKEAGV
eukprot:jgi/Botrbrau1/23126/Bobra.0243s0056.1